MGDFIFSSKNPEIKIAYFKTVAMHSRLELLLVCPDENKAKESCLEAEKTVFRLNDIFDRHRKDCSTFKLNGSRKICGAEEELFFAMELCEKFRDLTYGYFDISCLGKSNVRPAYEMVPENRSIILKDGVTLDFGGFAKGYALEIIRKRLHEKGIENALLNFGDSSVVGMGTHPLGECWQIKSGTGGRTFKLKDSALSTSGLSRGGEKHIVNPLNGEFSPSGGNISVEGRSALLCEVLSTALFAAPRVAEGRIMDSFEGYRAYYGS